MSISDEMVTHTTTEARLQYLAELKLKVQSRAEKFEDMSTVVKCAFIAHVQDIVTTLHSHYWDVPEKYSWAQDILDKLS